MISKDQIMEKIKSLPDESLEEIADFIKLLEAKEEGYPKLAEHGMGDYLSQLSAYEEMLATGKIKWR